MSIRCQYDVESMSICSTSIRQGFSVDSIRVQCRFDEDFDEDFNVESTRIRCRFDEDSTSIRHEFDVDSIRFRCRFRRGFRRRIDKSILCRFYEDSTSILCEFDEYSTRIQHHHNADLICIYLTSYVHPIPISTVYLIFTNTFTNLIYLKFYKYYTFYEFNLTI